MYDIFNTMGSQQAIWWSTTALLLAIWTIPWKGYALWIAARKSQKWWFIAILILNTVAILEILYIFVFSKMGKKVEAKQESPKN